MSEQNKKASQPDRRRGGPMGGGPMAMMPGDKAKNFKGTIRKLISYLKKYNVLIIIVMLLAAASAAFGVFGPKVMGTVINDVVAGLMNKIGGTGDIDFGHIGMVAIELLTLYVLSAVFAYVQGWIMTDITMKTTYRFRKDISEKIHRMPLKYFESVNHGEVLSRITNDVDTVSQTLNQSLSQIITSVTTVLGVLIMMFTISWQLALVVMCVIPATFIFVILIVKKSQKYFKSQQKYLGHVNGHIEEMYGGHVVMKAFNGEQRSIQKFDEFNNELYKSAWKSQFLSGLIMPIMNIIGNIGYVAVCVVGGFLASGVNPVIKIGDIATFINYVRNFTMPISQLANTSNILQQTAAAAERVFEFLEEEEEIPDNPNAVKMENVQGQVEFKDVHFGYNPENIIINDFSAMIQPGQRVAIVGPTGAGKTTMVKLLMRFYDVNSGAILVDNIDIRNITRDNLRSSFGMVLQDAWLYNGSIMENIRYGRLDATDEEVIQAAKSAYVHNFVQTLPNGYHMELNEEASNVSQGQKQLLTIARAILADPKILILDEATSSVDTRTEVHIQKAMKKLMQNRTSFVIAHRLSTIRDADLILVMKDGDIVEQGQHTELLEKKGFYFELYNSQFAGAEA